MILGIPDVWISSAYILCILSTAACVIYGLYNWNNGGDDEAQQAKEELKLEETGQ